jgi:chromatin remodeling complex protein RSC6
METEPKIPKSISKIHNKLNFLKEKMEENKKTNDLLLSEFYILEKWITKITDKLTEKKPTEKKPRGFARPVKVSDDVCDFMKRERGTLLSRTEVTKYLIHYIAENQLQDPEKKKVIHPDDSLRKILGEESIDQTITYFTIQNFMNKHFIK